jgi:hypothetical protein
VEVLEVLYSEERSKRGRGRKAIKREIADCGYMNGKYFMIIEAHEPTYRALERVKVAFWGIGKKGNGKNMLGVLLMEIRDKLSGMNENER